MTSTRDLLNRDTSLGGISYGNIDYNASRKKYNLSDLRKNEEFNKTTERFLKSIGEGDSVSDLFAYFRGSDYNLAQGLSVLAQSKKFTDQQKRDYQYLRSSRYCYKYSGIVIQLNHNYSHPQTPTWSL